MFKKVILGSIIVLFAALSGVLFGYNPVYAAEKGDVITRMYITDKDGNALTKDIAQWHQFRINADFDLTGQEVHAGDTTTVILPTEIEFVGGVAFDIKDSQENLVAKGAVIPNTKPQQIQITYTDYPETHSGTKGSFFFYVRVDHKVVEEKREIPIDITVSGKIVHAGKVQFEGIGEAVKPDITKSRLAR